ncbi:hypothetical protein [Longimicrobium sp.]|uniref:hypothetical protein n=1 Tax=Longimicrobium sp. TaxID=2029185 RepID=UPI002D1485EC|nr:hypothetical protein [Longimicrobium sp.]HSU13806.1 hypothetical protein [Longimicrobium sp.]
MAGPTTTYAPRPAPGTRALLVAAVLLSACGGAGANPAARERYEADDRRCRAMADSMTAVARTRGGQVDDDAYEPARLSCMSYRGWKDGKFR